MLSLSQAGTGAVSGNSSQRKDDAEEGEITRQPFAGLEQTVFDLAAGLQYLVPGLNPKSLAVPADLTPSSKRQAGQPDTWIRLVVARGRHCRIRCVRSATRRLPTCADRGVIRGLHVSPDSIAMC